MIGLCLCPEPHQWGGDCAGPAPTAEEARDALVARLRCASDDPVDVPVWDPVTETETSQEIRLRLIDPEALDLFITILERADLNDQASLAGQTPAGRLHPEPPKDRT
ncbi:hypothetical protein [Nocardioides ochotonae]|uniref:hypothetical protein n=1 Tax=Nocardioides ochotonae TaxID=2685869 RepID=UPI00140C9870|nr:hypothetical protein [Nocardioides ochotonae]